jgi:hypothetical protein
MTRESIIAEIRAEVTKLNRVDTHREVFSWVLGLLAER